jgi:hypothetical protein
MKLAKIFGKKQNKVMNIVLILGVVVVIGLVLRYNSQKGMKLDMMTGKNAFSNVEQIEQAPNAAAAPAGSSAGAPPAAAVSPVSTTDGEQFLGVKGMSSGAKSDKSCNNQQMMDPKELLPKDGNNEWSSIAPSKDLKNIHMLNAGHHIGINSVGSSLRNANLQIRSEPVIPQSNVGPWNNTTIEPDNMRRALEIGSSE